jgi:hypothetical protein
MIVRKRYNVNGVIESFLGEFLEENNIWLVLPVISACSNIPTEILK